MFSVGATLEPSNPVFSEYIGLVFLTFKSEMWGKKYRSDELGNRRHQSVYGKLLFCL